jgi:hypothetical protein
MRLEYGITRYSIEMTSSMHAGSVDPSTGSTPAAAAKILLFERRKFRGWLLFYPDGSRLQPAHLVDGKRVVLFFALSQFDTMVQILRNEERVKIYYETDPATPETGRAWLATAEQFVPRDAEQHLEEIAPGTPGTAFEPRP